LEILQHIKMIGTMRKIFHKNIYSTALCIFCIMISGCRKELYYEAVSPVTISVTWPDGISIPEGVRVIFYNEEGEGHYVFNIPSNGGTVNVPKGKYSVLMFNNDTEYIAIRNVERISTIQAYTSLLIKAGNTRGFPLQSIVNTPDLFYRYLQTGYNVNDNTSSVFIQAAPLCKVSNYTIKVLLIGSQYVSSGTGYLSGLAGSYYPGLDSLAATSSAVMADLGLKGADTLVFKINTFGISKAASRENIFRVSLTLINDSTRDFDFNITEALNASLNELNKTKTDIGVKVEIILSDTIKVEPVTTGGTSSGFSTTVTDWKEPDNVEILL
jgi:hypothetical protein